MAAHGVSTVRAFVLRRRRFNLVNSYSMGLRPGRQIGDFGGFGFNRPAETPESLSPGFKVGAKAYSI